MGSSAQMQRADAKRAGKGKKGSLPKDQQFVQLINAFRKEPSWLALSYAARCLYVEIKALYNGQNNGRIMCSVRFAAKLIGCSPSSGERLLKDLAAHGFIVETTPGILGFDGCGAGTLWRLTELGCNGDRPTKDYRNWQAKKNRTPPLKQGQGVPIIGTGADCSAPIIGTGCPDNRDGKGLKRPLKCPDNRDDLIYQGVGDASYAPVNGEFVGETRRFTAIVGGRA